MGDCARQVSFVLWMGRWSHFLFEEDEIHRQRLCSSRISAGHCLSLVLHIQVGASSETARSTNEKTRRSGLFSQFMAIPTSCRQRSARWLIVRDLRSNPLLQLMDPMYLSASWFKRASWLQSM